MSRGLDVVATWAVGDTYCLVDVTFKDAVTAAAVNISGFTPKLRGRGKRQSLAFTDITGTLLTPASGIARYDLTALNATADFYHCQAYVVDGATKIQTAETDFAVVFKATP
jgi:hypothetical protein